MFTRQLALVFAGGLLVPPPAAASDSPPRVAVIARIYNAAGIRAAAADAALAVAAHTLAASGVDIRWRDCDGSSDCGLPPAAGELIIRLARSSVTVAQAAFALGDAFIDMKAGSGVFATIYVDRVEQMAVMSATDVAVLLGRTIAHELAHLLLATSAHSLSGLMRAYWTAADLRRDDVADWMLTGEEAEAIRKRFR